MKVMMMMTIKMIITMMGSEDDRTTQHKHTFIRTYLGTRLDLFGAKAVSGLGLDVNKRLAAGWRLAK